MTEELVQLRERLSYLERKLDGQMQVTPGRPLEIVDADGATIARISHAPGWGGRLDVLNERGECVVTLAAVQQGGTIELCHPNGAVSVQISASTDGLRIVSFDSAGTPHASSVVGQHNPSGAAGGGDDDLGKVGLIRRRTEEIAALYADQSVLRVIVSLLPTGPLVDLVLSSAGQRHAERKFHRFLGQIQSQIEAIGQDKLDRSFFETEAGYDLLHRCVQKCMATSAQHRVQLYVRILMQGMLHGTAASCAEEYLEVLGGLDETEVIVASGLYGAQRDVADPEDGSFLRVLGERSRVGFVQAQIPSLETHQVEAALRRLTRTGLVAEFTGGFMGYSGGAFHITQYFRDLVDWLGTNELLDESAAAGADGGEPS